MLYDLTHILDRERFKRRCNELFKRGCIVELTDKTRRSTRQNAYLHLLVGYFAMETGNSADFVKREYFKRLCNRDLFVTEVDDEWLGRVEVVRSSAELSKDEMSTAIERFRNWSSQEAGIYLPSANEDAFLASIEVELGRVKQWI